MSNVRGRIAVDVQFTDSTTSEGVQSLKSITLQDATEYTTGKVAIVTGTCGTAVIQVTTSPTTYRNADGQIVSFANVERVVCKATRPCSFGHGIADCGEQTFCAFGSSGTFNVDVAPNYTAGTASYTIVLYGT